VPSRQGLRYSTRTRPSARRLSRSRASGGQDTREDRRDLRQGSARCPARRGAVPAGQGRGQYRCDEPGPGRSRAGSPGRSWGSPGPHLRSAGPPWRPPGSPCRQPWSAPRPPRRQSRPGPSCTGPSTPPAQRGRPTTRRTPRASGLASDGPGRAPKPAEAHPNSRGGHTHEDVAADGSGENDFPSPCRTGRARARLHRTTP
jgi:hypothetical protein